MQISRIKLRRLINEIVDSVSGKIKVYHMFGDDRHTGLEGIGTELSKNQVLDRVKTIMTKGFLPGELGLFGKGLYGFDADTFRSLSEAGNYGNYALEFEIKDFSRYLVFNYEKSRDVKGENYRLIDQFKSMGINPETVLFTHKESRGLGASLSFIENKVTARDFSNDVDMYNEEGDLDDNDALMEYVSALSENKSLGIHGCFIKNFFVCWNLKSVILTGYCDDTFVGEVKPLPNIAMQW